MKTCSLSRKWAWAKPQRAMASQDLMFVLMGCSFSLLPVLPLERESHIACCFNFKGLTVTNSFWWRPLNNALTVTTSKTHGIRLNTFYIMRYPWTFGGKDQNVICEYEMSLIGSCAEALSWAFGIVSGGALVNQWELAGGSSHWEMRLSLLPART